MVYRVKKPFDQNPTLVTLLSGKKVGLNSTFEITFSGTKNGPGAKFTVRQATQHDLKQLFEDGNPLIEKVDDVVESMVESAENEELTKQGKKRKLEKKDG